MTREILTDEAIIHDLLLWEKRKASSSQDHALSFAVPAAVVGVVLWILWHWAAGVVLLCAAAALTVPYILHLRASRRRQARIREGGFTVTEQTLVSAGQESMADPHTTVGGGRLLREVSLLRFDGGEWQIPARNYTWSQTYNMSREGVMNTAMVGDVFYTVTADGSGEIAAAYSSKLFERKVKK